MAKIINRRQKLFCDLYMSNGGNSKSAALGAGYLHTLKKTDALLHSDVIQNYLRDARPGFIELVGTTPEIIVDALVRIAEADPLALYDPETGKALPPHLLGDEIACAVSEVAYCMDSHQYSYKLEADVPALELLARISGAFDQYQRAKNTEIVMHFHPQDLLT